MFWHAVNLNGLRSGGGFVEFYKIYYTAVPYNFQVLA